MKNIFKLATLLFTIATLSFVGCTEDPLEGFIGNDQLSAKVKSEGASSVTLSVHTEGLSRIAWLAKRTDNASGEVTAPMPVIIFSTGSQKEVSNGTHSVVVNGLAPNATYNVYLVGEIASSGDLTKSVVEIGVKTSSFTEDFNVHSINYRGFSVDVKVPERVKEEDHLIKWATSDIFLYNKTKYSVRGLLPDAENLVLHDKTYGDFFFDESTTLVINEDESFTKNPDGTPNYKGTYLYETIVPGQPQILIIGEHEFAQSPVGWGWGYYGAMFDMGAWASAVAKNDGEPVDETPYWDGLYYHELVQVQKPEKLPDSTMSLDIERSTDDAVITVTVNDKEVRNVCIMVLDDEQHDIAFHHLGGKDYEHFQWFATSMVGMMEGAADQYDPFGVDPLTNRPRNGIIRTALSQYLLNVSQTSHYWVYAVAIKGDLNNDGYLDGHQQLCLNEDFDLIETTKPAPELVVEALEPTKPNTALFRLTCPSAANGNGAAKGWYMSNYEKAWLSEGMSAQEIIDAYALIYPDFAFDALDLDKINSPEGLTLEFPSRPNENYHFAAMIKNDEGTPCYSDKVVCRTYEAAVPRVESEYFESLKGEWTATATIRYKVLKEGVDPESEVTEDDYELKTSTATCNITIGEADYPMPLPQSAYDFYANYNKDKATVDGYYKDLTDALDLFNETNRAQNRMLATGFNFAGENLSVLPYFNYQSAYDLFVSPTYSALSNAMPAYDFGPKWFIEVQQDGSLAVPFNSEYFPPMASWAVSIMNQAQELHMVAYEPTTKTAAGYLSGVDELGYLKAETGYFPIEVSDGGNTLTIKPYVYSDGNNSLNFYLNTAVYGGPDPETGQPAYGMSIAIISEITLTRGATEGAHRVAAYSAGMDEPVRQYIEPMNEIKTAIRPRKRSNFDIGGVSMVGPDHSLTTEQRAEKWLNMRRIADK